MKRIIVFISIIALSLALISCNQKHESKMLQQTISKENLNEIITNLSNDDLISSQELLLFSNGIGRLSSFNTDTLIGMSVKDVIAIEDEVNKSKNVAVLRTTGNRVLMNLNYEIKYLGVKQVKDTINNIDGQAVLYEIKNTSGKGIKKLAGIMQFFNQQNQLIKQFELDNPQELAPNASLQFYKAFSYNPQDQRDSLIRFFNKNMIVRWQPKTIEFADGMKIEIK